MREIAQHLEDAGAYAAQLGAYASQLDRRIGSATQLLAFLSLQAQEEARLRRFLNDERRRRRSADPAAR